MNKIVALAGGVGGAKLAHGLYQVLAPDTLTLIGNTADDFELFGVHISPDLDTVMYTLAGLANNATGWGVSDETFTTLEMLGRYGRDTWFRLGDKDFATHLLRTQMIRAGQTLTSATATLVNALQIRARLLPMCDEPVATVLDTEAGWLDFQEYFVKRHHGDTVKGVVFQGVETAHLSPEVGQALREAEAIIFCPSNPIVSIGPILAVPGLREQLVAAPGVKVAVSPIVSGQAIRGPADQMLRSLGHEVSALGVARHYQGIIQGMVIDELDVELGPRIGALGMEWLVTQTVMQSEDDRVQLAKMVLSFCQQLREHPKRYPPNLGSTR